MDTAAPWGTAGAFLIAKWLPRDETTVTIVQRIDALLSEVSGELGTGEWVASNGAPWEGDLAALVAAHAVVDDLGDPDPAYGYTMTLIGTSPTMRLTVRVMAGARVAGRRAPNNRLTIEINELTPGAFSTRVADLVTEAVVTAWQPIAVAFRNDDLIDVAARGGWSIPVGYRTWVADSVGNVTSTATQITARRLEHGTFLSAPDAWAADDAASAMLATLQGNSLDKIPH